METDNLISGEPVKRHVTGGGLAAYIRSHFGGIGEGRKPYDDETFEFENNWKVGVALRRTLPGDQCLEHTCCWFWRPRCTPESCGGPYVFPGDGCVPNTLQCCLCFETTHVEIAFRFKCTGAHHPRDPTHPHNCIVFSLLSQGALAPVPDASDADWEAYYERIGPQHNAHPDQHPGVDAEGKRVEHQVSFTATYEGMLLRVDRAFADENAYHTVFGLRMAKSQRVIAVQFLLSQLGRPYNWRGYYCDFWPCLQCCTRMCPAGVVTKEVLPFQLHPEAPADAPIEEQSVYWLFFEEAMWEYNDANIARDLATERVKRLNQIPSHVPVVEEAENGSVWQFSNADLQEIEGIQGHGSGFMQGARDFPLFVPNPLRSANWFCSEVVMAALMNAGLFNPGETISPAITSPHDLHKVLEKIATDENDGRVYNLQRIGVRRPSRQSIALTGRTGAGGPAAQAME